MAASTGAATEHRFGALLATQCAVFGLYMALAVVGVTPHHFTVAGCRAHAHDAHATTRLASVWAGASIAIVAACAVCGGLEYAGAGLRFAMAGRVTGAGSSARVGLADALPGRAGVARGAQRAVGAGRAIRRWLALAGAAHLTGPTVERTTRRAHGGNGNAVAGDILVRGGSILLKCPQLIGKARVDHRG